MGAGLRAASKGVELTTGPYRLFLTACPAVTQGVTGQKSAEAILVTCNRHSSSYAA